MIHNFLKHVSFLVRHVVSSFPKQSSSYTTLFQTSLMIIILPSDLRIHHIFLPYFHHMYAYLHTTLHICSILSWKILKLLHIFMSLFWNKYKRRRRRKRRRMWDYVFISFKHVTWHIMECVIAWNNRDRPFSLTWRGTWRTLIGRWFMYWKPFNLSRSSDKL